jgi:azurin
MIYGLRRYDVDRCAALIDNSDPKNKDVQVVGFMSHKAKIYLVSPDSRVVSYSHLIFGRPTFSITWNTV